jgi:hypothetical protein
MKSTPSSQPAVEGSVPSDILPSDTGFHHAGSAVESISASAQLGPRRIGYGLPCVKCKTYYAADLSACPVCKTEERVLPMRLDSVNCSLRLPESVAPAPDEVALEEERECVLREFKAQVYASEPEIDASAGLGCSLEASHQGAFEPATVCQSCFDQELMGWFALRGGPWSGTASELLAALKTRAGVGNDSWPQSPRALYSHIESHTQILRSLGVDALLYQKCPRMLSLRSCQDEKPAVKPSSGISGFNRSCDPPIEPAVLAADHKRESADSDQEASPTRDSASIIRINPTTSRIAGRTRQNSSASLV